MVEPVFHQNGFPPPPADGKQFFDAMDFAGVTGSGSWHSCPESK